MPPRQPVHSRDKPLSVIHRTCREAARNRHDYDAETRTASHHAGALISEQPTRLAVQAAAAIRLADVLLASAHATAAGLISPAAHPLSDIVCRRTVDDAISGTMTGPGGQRGTTTDSNAAGSHPHTSTSDKPLPGSATSQPATPFSAASRHKGEPCDERSRGVGETEGRTEQPARRGVSCDRAGWDCRP